MCYETAAFPPFRRILTIYGKKGGRRDFFAWSAQHKEKVAYLSPGSFQRPGGHWGPHPRAKVSEDLRPWPAAFAYGFLVS